MRMRRWLALALASTLVGCYVDPYSDDPSFDPGSPSDPTPPAGSGWSVNPTPPAQGGYGNTSGSDTTPPAAPVITEASWQSGSIQNGLRVKGTTEPGAEVGIFIDSACQGFPAATVFAGSNGAFTAELTVTASSAATVRRLFVAARDAAFNESPCVEGPSYTAPCAMGYADCDGNPANGCEVNPHGGREPLRHLRHELPGSEQRDRSLRGGDVWQRVPGRPV